MPLKTNILAGIIAGAGGSTTSLTVNEVVEGDSNTLGLAGTPYATQAQSMLTASNSYVYQNIATSGISTLTLNSNYATRAGNKLDVSKNINLLSYLAGTNTSGTNDDEPVEKYLLIRDYLTKGFETGYNRIIVGTYFARGDNGAYWSQVLVRTNQLIRSYWFCDLLADGLFDFAANPSFDSSDDAQGAPNYSADKLHLTTQGFSLVAPGWASLVNSLAGAKPPFTCAPVFTPFGGNRNVSGSVFTFSNNNRSISVTTGVGQYSAPIPMYRKSGKYYWELEVNSVGGQVHVGIGNKNMSFGAYVGTSGNNSVGWSYDGNVRIANAVVLAMGLPLQANDVCHIAMDIDSRKVWFRRRRSGVNSNWNNDISANPETGVNGIDISVLGDANTALRGLASLRTVTDSVTLRAASSEFTASAPIGFDPYGGGVSAIAPLFTQTPVISGTGVQGSVLTVSTPASVSGNNNPNITYQVRRNGSVIYGGTGLTYTLTSAVSGDVWDVVATAMSIGGEVTSTSNTITTP